MKKTILANILFALLASSYGLNCLDGLLHRTMDGSCNNLLNPKLGKSNELFKVGPEGTEYYPEIYEEVPDPLPTYENIHLMPDDTRGGNPRNISNTLASLYDPTLSDPRRRNMFSVMFGQFIAHDIENNRFGGSEVADFLGNFVTLIRDRNDDACYYQNTYRCKDDDTVLVVASKKSAGKFHNDGTFTPYNNATTYLDLSQVYGTDKNIANKLRSKVGGKLLTLSSRTFDLTMRDNTSKTYTIENTLPISEDHPDIPVDGLFDLLGGKNWAFVAGDHRVNENLGLLVLHTVWLREHNKVCDELMDRNLLWKLFPTIFDELIYQKARHIVISKYQRIVLRQYLPSIVGFQKAQSMGEYSGYNILVDPRLTSTFASAAFRYGHFSLKDYPALDECGIVYKYGRPDTDEDHKIAAVAATNPVPDSLSPVGRIAESGSLGNIARGMIYEVATPINFTTHPALRNQIGDRGRFDLPALDIMRARYNSVPRYVDIRREYHKNSNPLLNNIYGNTDCPAYLENQLDVEDPIECFLYILSDLEKAEKLRYLYGKVSNIDAIVGLMLEEHDNSSSIGETAANIIVDQFKRLRDGDRFYYEALISQNYFDTWEKNQILNTSMGEILRRNLDGANETFPDNPFITPEGYKEYLKNLC